MLKKSMHQSCIKLILFLFVSLLSYTLLYAQSVNAKNVYKHSSSQVKTQNSSSLANKKFDIDLGLYINFRRNRQDKNIAYQNFKYTSYIGNKIRSRNSSTIEYWLKVVRSDNSNFDNKKLLIIKPHSLNSVELYIPEINSYIPIESSKSNTVNTVAKYSKRAFAFNLPNSTNYKAAYLRIKSSNHPKLDVELWNADEYYKEDARFNDLLSMLYGVLLIAIFMNLLFFIALQQKKYLLYCVYVLGLLIVLASASGKIFEYTFANYLATSINKLVLFKALSCLLLMLLIQNLTSLKLNTGGLFKLFEGIKLFYALIIGLCIAVKPLPESIEAIFNFSILIFVLLCFTIPFLSWGSKKRDIHYIAYSIAPIIIGYTIYSLAGIGSLEKSIYTQSAIQLGLVIHALIISLGLSSNILLIKKQLLSIQETNRQHSLSLEIEKQHANLINHVKSYVRFNPDADQEYEIVSRFFEQLKHSYVFEKASLIYQLDSQLIVKADLKKYQTHFVKLVNDNLIEISRLCHGNKISEIKPKKLSAYFEKNTKFLVIPVFLRGQEWSGMLVNLKDVQEYSEEQKNSLHRYATEAVRSLLNTQMINNIRSELKTDPISKLLNRAAIFEELDLLIKDTQYSDKPSSIALLKVGSYIQINEEYGHEIAHVLLRYIAEHLKASFDEDVLIGRTSNSDFLILFSNSSATEASHQLNKVRKTLKPMSVKDTHIDIQFYLAVSQCYGAFESAREIMRRVDKGIQAAQNCDSNKVNIQE